MRGIVGRDFSAFDVRGDARRWVLLGAAALVAAFALVALRTEVLKLRYELAQGLDREQQLRAAQRDLTVQMRELREPRALAERAFELGFVRPERILDLEPTPPAPVGLGAAYGATSTLGTDTAKGTSPGDLTGRSSQLADAGEELRP